MYALNGDELSYPVRFLVEGDYVVPDADSVKVTLRGQTGNVISGWNRKAIDHEAKSAIKVVIDGSANTTTGGQREKRTVIVEFEVDGVAFKRTSHYFLTDYLNITATPADVRRVFGVEPTELPDSMVSVEEAYYDLIRIYNDKTTLDTALGDSDKMQMANQLIVAAAANRVLQSLQTRLYKIEASDQESFTRFDVDFPAMAAKVAAMGTEAADAVFDRSEVSPPLLIKVTPTDVITGA